MADLLALSAPRRARGWRPTRCHLAVLAALAAMAPAAQAAPPGTVLPAGTIPVLRGLVSDYSQSATFATAAAAGGGQALTITQLKPKIVIDWKQFDIGSASSVRFDQPSSSAVALNRIYDLNPSTIQGKLLANGQVYLVNQNGILFDRGAQVDVNTLIASTLNIADSVFNGSLTQGHTFTPAFSGGYDAQGKTVAGAKTGAIQIGVYGPDGAAAPRIAASAGGMVALLAPVINNQSGLIAAPDGQVILAAGSSVYLDFSNSDSTSLRGMLVQVTADQGPVNLSSLIANSGSISADRGNVTLAALAINQSGRVSASSAMLENGSIYLQANTLNDGRRGSVNLAAGSVTETPLDLTDTTTLRASDSYTPYQSVVNITGAQIVNEGRVSSPGGKIALDAMDPASKADARIYLAPGSVIDASGAWSNASAASNLLTFKVTSNELANAPDQKGGLLQGATVTVNLAAGSNVLDLSGYQQSRTQTLAQKAAEGGSVSLNTSGSLIARTDSTVNVSGGGVHYAAATLDTTQLIGADGKVYDIATAPEALQYVAIADSFTQKQPRWGFNQTYANPASSNGVAQAAYSQGAAAGSVSITMGKGGNNGLVLDGNLLGGVTVGSQQRNAAPAGGVLTVGFFDGSLGSAKQDFGIGDVTWLNGVLSSLPAGFAAGSALSGAAKNQLNLSTSVFGRGSVDAQGDYVTQGFGTVNLYANGQIVVPRGVSLQGPVGGTLSLRANQVEIDGSLAVPAGKLTAEVVNTTGSPTSPLSASAVVLGSGASIDASGAWINSAIAAQTSALPTAVLGAGGVATSTLDGGSVTLSGPVLNLGKGSVVAVNAGGSVSAAGSASGGAGGSITLQATGVGAAPLVLGGSLQGWGFGNGGSLALSTGSTARIGSGSDNAYALNLDPSFFTTGGFDAFSLATGGNLTLAAGSTLKPQATTWQLSNALALALPSRSSAAGAAVPVLLPDATRPATQLSLAAGAALSLQSGSRIDADAGAAVKLSGASGVALDGSVSAPGGSIAVTLAVPGDAPTPALLELGSGATLSTRGSFVATPNDQQLLQGTLRGGGSITLTAQKAAIQLDPGSTVDVSGASQLVDQLTGPGALVPYQKVLLNSNAGTLRISGNDRITLGGALLGQASGSAAGGAFSLSIGERGDLFDPYTRRRIVVTQAGTPVAADAAYKDASVSVSKLLSGGFDKLALQSEDQILFATDATLRFNRGVSLNAQLLNVSNDAQVLISGSKVTLANTIGQRVPNAANDPSNPTSRLDASLPSLPQPTAAGQGSFSVDAGTLSLLGSVTIGGTQRESLAATNDIQLSGRTVGVANSQQGATLEGGLVTAGSLALQAAQIYPTTASNFSIAVADGLSGNLVPGGRIDIGSNGGARGVVYSAGGRLSLRADTIQQNGVLLAPLGSLSLTAGTALDLGAQSITSVSANGQTIPYGETQAGVNWTYAATNSNLGTGPLSAPPAKQLTLSAPSITARAGSTIDVSGGGDIAAVEFVPGSGGSTNVLTQSNTYAIVPAARLASAPVDPDIALAQNLGFGNIGSVYDSVRIGAGGPVAAGNYLLLPGYYALLPGAYMVQLLTGSAYANLKPGQTVSLANGQTVVSGVMTASGTSVAAQGTVGVLLRPSAEISKLADYQVTHSSFFADRASAAGSATPRLPGDGGQLTIQASQALSLNGTLAAALPGAASRAAEVDIAADRIALVDQVGNANVGSGFLQIDAASLSKLGASLLVGGTRSESASGLTVTPTASDIVVANTAATALSAPELVLAATGSITFKAGSSVTSSSGAGGQPDAIQVGGSNAASGALVRVSNGGLAAVERPAGTATSGSVVIESGARLSSTGSLTIDATLDTRSAGQIAVAAGGALSLVSGHLSLGDAVPPTGSVPGLVLSNTELAGFSQLGTLSLRSYSGIDVFGSAVIGSAQSPLGHLVVDAASFSGQAGTAASVALNAQSVDLVNSNAAVTTARAGGADAGSFTVNAKQITLGAGDKAIGGFAAAQFNAAGALLASGTGSLTVAAPLQLQATRVDSVSGAQQQWTAATDATSASAQYFPVTLGTPAAPATLAASGAIGSRVQISGASVSDAAPIVMKGGAITLQALGSQPGADVQLLGPALLDAGGITKDFQGTKAVADAGQVTLFAPNGNVTMGSSARIDVAADAAGGHAGALAVTAQAATLGGTLAGAGASGRFSLDVGSVGDFSALNRQVAQAGFSGALDIRQRSGDLVVGAADTVKAGQVVLEADAGTLAVNGRIDAIADLGGGSVALYGRSVTLAAGSVIDASGTSTRLDSGSTTAPYANGGSVKVVAEGGPLVFASGAQINVRPGAKGQAGSVLLRAPRGAQGTGLNATLAGQVLSQRNGSTAAEVDVEGTRIYTLAASGAVIGAAQINGYAQDNASFMASPVGTSIRGDDGVAPANVHLRPAVEVQAAGDITLASNWNLTGTGWLIKPPGANAAEAGSLAVRAGGNLTLAGTSIGNPDDGLQSGSTWNIALASGADLGAANVLRTQPLTVLAAQAAQRGAAQAGDLLLRSGSSVASVRTGTGSIELAAGRDFTISAGTDPDTGNALVGVVYTSGKAAIVDPNPVIASPADYRFAQGGGDVSISAGRNATGAGNEWVTEWLRSPTDGPNGFDPNQGVWWASRSNFHDGVAALGGGNVSLRAGQDIVNLSAWTPSSALLKTQAPMTELTTLGSGAQASLAVFGGGRLDVGAGRDIVGGQYLVGRGSGRITAGGSIGAGGVASELYLMGASGDPALAQASLRVNAGGSVNLAGINNPGTLYQTTTGIGEQPGYEGGDSVRMLSLSSNSAVQVSAGGGDIRYGINPLYADPLPEYAADNAASLADFLRVATITAFPAHVNLTAFNGNIVNAAPGRLAVLFPAADSSVKLLAGKGISNPDFTVSDADPAQFSAFLAGQIVGAEVLLTKPSTPSRIVVNTSGDRYVNDFVALGGDIVSPNLGLPARSRLWASEDIVQPALKLQNLEAGDVTAVVADTGSIGLASDAPTTISGPGELLVQAGRDLNLGTRPLISYGNQINTQIADPTGARITLAAGLSGNLDLAAIDPGMKSLVQAGKANDETAAKAAVATLFAGTQLRSGNINTYLTSVQSYAGGEVNLLAPAGNITVGLSTSNPANVGLVTNAGGAIQSYLSGDFDINRGKVLTAQGGDISIYTAQGSIDAGRGAKTAVTTPPPVRTPTYDSNGLLTGYTYSIPASVAGSGIQTATSKPSGPTSVAPKAGDINLFAPAGTINAGEAGITSAGNIFVAALSIVNADNISAGGSSNAPVPQVGSVASTLAAGGSTTAAEGAANAGAAAQAAAAAAQAAAAQAAAAFKPNVLTVEVLGFGDKNCKETDKDCFAK